MKSMSTSTLALLNLTKFIQPMNLDNLNIDPFAHKIHCKEYLKTNNELLKELYSQMLIEILD